MTTHLYGQPLDPARDPLATPEERHHIRRLKTACEDYRRQLVTALNPWRPGAKSPWPVQLVSEVPRWSCITSKGGTRTFTESRPPTSSGILETKNGPKNGSVFTLKVLKPVDVSNGSTIATAEAGDTVVAFAATALALADARLVEIIGELRP
jgi:hypothetical protein